MAVDSAGSQGLEEPTTTQQQLCLSDAASLLDQESGERPSEASGSITDKSPIVVPAPSFEDHMKLFLTSLREEAERSKPNANDLAPLTDANAGYADWVKAAQGFKRIKPLPTSLSERHERFVRKLDQLRPRVEAKTRSILLNTLFAAQRPATGDDHGLAVAKVADSPLTVVVGILTVTLDLKTAKATLAFGLEPIAKVPLDAPAILKRHAEIVAEYEELAMDNTQFFELLRKAYHVQLTLEQKQAGDRVDLVDLPVLLVVLRATVIERRKKNTKAIRPFPRHVFAYMLWRLRRGRHLKQDGLRLDLGSATGGSTRVKHNVLYIPSRPSDGQYYLSLRFVPTEDG